MERGGPSRASHASSTGLASLPEDHTDSKHDPAGTAMAWDGRSSVSMADLSVPPSKALPRVLRGAEKNAFTGTSPSRARAVPRGLGSRDFKPIPADVQKKRLQTLDVMVLDNSLRETTVANPRGLTLVDKASILEHVDLCGFNHKCIGAFNGKPRVDDEFARQLRDAGYKHWDKCWGFAEYKELFNDDWTWDYAETAGMRKLDQLHVPNAILEVDLTCKKTDWSLMTAAKVHHFTEHRCRWVKEHLGGQVFINIRDLCGVYEEGHKQRLWDFVVNIAKMKEDIRPIGLLFEDPAGETYLQDMSDYVASVRRRMDANGWKDGEFLVHVHKNYGMAEALVLAALGSGATGIWCATCENGASVGHACSVTTLANLARLGNEFVRKNYNIPAVRDAAIAVCRIVSREDPHPLTEVYGARAFDTVFDPEGGMSGGYDAAGLFKVKPHIRISTMTTPRLMRVKLHEVFPDEKEGADDWDMDVSRAMFARVSRDLLHGVRADYNSPLGVLRLYEAAGGKASDAMKEYASATTLEVQDNPLLDELEDVWSTFAGDIEKRLSYQEFYDSWGARYMPCYACDRFDETMAVLDPNGCGGVRYMELRIRAEWVLLNYGDHDVDGRPRKLKTVDQLIDAIFELALVHEVMAARKTLHLKKLWRKLMMHLRDMGREEVEARMGKAMTMRTATSRALRDVLASAEHPISSRSLTAQHRESTLGLQGVSPWAGSSKDHVQRAVKSVHGSGGVDGEPGLVSPAASTPASSTRPGTAMRGSRGSSQRAGRTAPPAVPVAGGSAAASPSGSSTTFTASSSSTPATRLQSAARRAVDASAILRRIQALEGAAEPGGARGRGQAYTCPPAHRAALPARSDQESDLDALVAVTDLDEDDPSVSVP